MILEACSVKLLAVKVLSGLSNRLVNLKQVEWIFGEWFSIKNLHLAYFVSLKLELAIYAVVENVEDIINFISLIGYNH